MSAHTVWLGPPGSGKTTRLLEALRGPLRDFRDDFRLIVPTATMAGHLRHALARQGLVLRSNTILTVTGHARELAGQPRLVSAPALEMYLGEILARRCPPEFRELRELPGFLPLLAATLEELANAGCDAYTWQGFLSLEPGSRPVAQAIAALWPELQARTASEGLLTRHQYLQRAAQALRDGALPQVRSFFWDGFTRLAAAERDLIRAQAERGAVTVTLPAWMGAARGGLVALRREGFAIRRFTPVRPAPLRLLVCPATAEDEAAEIARRILEHHRAGRPWHEIGVIVRHREPYVPLLESTFARFGIPVRPYFATPVAAHPVARLFAAAVEALLSGWKWEPLLDAILSPAGLAGACPACASFEYKLREELPNTGLERPRELARALPGAPPLLAFLNHLAGFEAWREAVDSPAGWSLRLAALNSLLAPPRSGPGPGLGDVAPQIPPPDLGPLAANRPDDAAGQIDIWRARAQAAAAWLGALAATAELLSAEPVSLPAFIEQAQPALRAAALPAPQFRRDAVHLIDAQEARQWELPVVFVCGLLEGLFPGLAQPDPLLGEALRSALRRRGIAVRTRAGRDAEERFLFDVALTRSTVELVLSYPRLNPQGEPTLGAFALERIPGLISAPPVACDVTLRPPAAPRIPPDSTLQARPNHQEFARGTPHDRPEFPVATPPDRGAIAAQTALSRGRITARAPLATAPLPLLPRPEAALSPAAAPALARRHPHFSPTGLETFLECPFHFFAQHSLRITDPPAAPEERFDAPERGKFIHAVLAQYHRLGGDLLARFQLEWSRTLKSLRVPASYRLELERARIVRSLRVYAADPPGQPGWEAHLEERFELPVGDAIVRGRIDRYEVGENGDCVLYDYKFSRPSSVASIVRKESAGRGLQAGLYLLAVQRKSLHPLSFYYVAVKGACALMGWDQPPDLDSLMNTAGQQAARAAREILAGRIAVAPIDEDSCAFCSFMDACRIREIGYRDHGEETAVAAGE
jgi:RecB family exonuclease